VANFILTAAIRAVKSKVGTWRAFEAIQDLVPEVSREEWAAAIGEARAALSQRVSEITRPLNRRPNASEFGPTLERRSSAKFWQTVEIYVRDKTTGARAIMHFTTRTDTLRSRISVINESIERLQGRVDGAPEDYPIDIVGFAYTGTYPIAPRK
jgi:hypothetical protein